MLIITSSVYVRHPFSLGCSFKMANSGDLCPKMDSRTLVNHMTTSGDNLLKNRPRASTSKYGKLSHRWGGVRDQLKKVDAVLPVGFAHEKEAEGQLLRDCSLGRVSTFANSSVHPQLSGTKGTTHWSLPRPSLKTRNFRFSLLQKIGCSPNSLHLLSA